MDSMTFVQSLVGTSRWLVEVRVLIDNCSQLRLSLLPCNFSKGGTVYVIEAYRITI